MVFPTVVATETDTANGVRRSDASQDGEASGDIGETLPALVGHELGRFEVGASRI
jgi:Zn-dependent alcohol dehydrogenase